MGFLSAYSQQKGDYEAGLNIGVNFSSASYPKDYINEGPKYHHRHPRAKRLNISGFGSYFFSSRWSIKAKLAYDQKGWDDYVQSPNKDILITSDYHLNYLTLPVVINWHFGRKRNWYVNYGPYIGFLLGSKDASFNTNSGNSPKTIDNGSTFGMGLKIPVANRVKIFFEAEMQTGNKDILKTIDGTFNGNLRTSLNTGVVVRI